MKLDSLIRTAPSWMRGDDDADGIVISCRARLARNLAKYPFASRITEQQQQDVIDEVLAAAKTSRSMSTATYFGMSVLDGDERRLLVERHLISPTLADEKGERGVLFNQDESLSVMINEEDHLRMQALLPGLQVDKAWMAIDQFDTALESNLDYAFCKRRGYLTACPTNLGTGIRVSAMLHLPGLVLSEQINQIIQAVNKLGLAVRGLHGEGTEALGNVFQVSNQMTLGETESDIVERLNKVLLQIIDHEENARAKLLENKAKMVYNHIGRAYGILANSHSISSKETMNLLSLFRLGIDLSLFPGNKPALTEELFIITQPAHLQKTRAGKLSAEKRDILRANLLRSRLLKVDRPATPDTGKTEENGE